VEEKYLKQANKARKLQKQQEALLDADDLEEY